MRLLVTGICGFVGSTIACALQDHFEGSKSLAVFGIDNLSRPGSERNRGLLKKRGIGLFHGDLRLASDLQALPPFDWVIDAAANPSVLAGVDGRTSSRQILDHNLASTVNLLESCKRLQAGFILLSTSRVYSIRALASLPMTQEEGCFRLDCGKPLPPGVTKEGVSEEFSTAPPISLYGASKLASEILALEYGEAFGFPVWINRCGLLAGAGQFGRADQGIVSFWINACLRRRPLRYIGFGGNGYQARDCLHPTDLVPALRRQFAHTAAASTRVFNFSGGPRNTFSLRQLTDWCGRRFGDHEVGADPKPRPFDIPWMVMDAGLARTCWDWQPQTPMSEIFEEIARHAENHPDWLDLSAES